MKNLYYLSLGALCLFTNSIQAQTFSPINTTGYNLDAVAENTPATTTTGGPIDGSNYVLYSVAYGALYSVSNGLPNSGLISSGTRTYQLQPYTANNVLYLTALTSGTISLVTPAPYAGLSLLGFATEGNATFDITLRFTDNSTAAYPNQSYLDWFGTGTAIISGFDRASRPTGTPNSNFTNPKMYALDLPLTCANRAKNVSEIIFQSTSTNARICVMAVSGASAPTFSANTNPVTCNGGTNGSAAITATGGIAPYTYTWSTTPAQSNSIAVSLPVGAYSYSVQDNGGCVVTGAVNVTQSLAVQPNLTLGSNIYTVCSGNSFTMGVSGAATYTWYSGSNASVFSPPVVTASTPTTITYTVSGLTFDNCLLTGSLNILINPIPAASFGSSISPVCKTAAPFLLSTFVQQSGGSFSGTGVVSGSFVPLNSGVGTFVVTYLQTDANNCSNTATTSVQVFSLAAPAVSPAGPYCSNAAAVQITANPTGGIFSGIGLASSGLFDPAIAGGGTHFLSYSITSGPCTTTAGINVLVNAAPTASIVSTKTFFCKNSPAVFLNGSPTGGTFSGQGLNGQSFSPALATVGNNNIIIYTYVDLNGCQDSASVRITVSNCVGINEAEKTTSSVKVFPNPGNGSVQVSAIEKTAIIITNELGQIVLQFQLAATNNYTEKIDVAAGIYFVNALSDSGQSTCRLVVTN